MSNADQCWCGEDVVHEEWCREHAPRCRSGAHYKNNCKCNGSDVRRMKIDSFVASIRKRVDNYDNDLNTVITNVHETTKLLEVVEAAVAWMSQPGMDWKSQQGSAFGTANHRLLKAVKGLGR